MIDSSKTCELLGLKFKRCMLLFERHSKIVFSSLILQVTSHLNGDDAVVPSPLQNTCNGSIRTPLNNFSLSIKRNLLKT